MISPHEAPLQVRFQVTEDGRPYLEIRTNGYSLESEVARYFCAQAKIHGINIVQMDESTNNNFLICLDQRSKLA